MKKSIFLVLIVISTLAVSNKVSAQDSGFGAGIMFGEPTGVSIKLWTSKTTALDAGLAWSFYNGGFMHIHADFLMHKFNVIDVNSGRLPMYFGIGARLGLGTDLHIGARVPIGLDYLFDEAPVDIFLEIAPGLDLTPATTFALDGGVGVRYFF